MRRLLLGLGVLFTFIGCGGSDSSGLTGNGTGGASTGGANTGGAGKGGASTGGASTGGAGGSGGLAGTPAGGAGGTTPSGGAGGTEPIGGAGGTEPTGGAGGTTPTGGAGGTTPTGGAGGTTPLGGAGGTTPTGGTGGTPTGGTGGTPTGGAGGTGGGVLNPVGCSDGDREAFDSISSYPNIAACAGGFSVAGTRTPASMAPACNLGAGDDGANPTGSGCSVADFCAKGWHVCKDAADVQKSSPSGCEGANSFSFYATRQSMTLLPSLVCDGAATSNNNVVGCGANGASVSTSNACAPLSRIIRTDWCPSGWSCGFDSANEALHVTKGFSSGGGVLCCRD